MNSTGLSNGRVGADAYYQWAIRFQAARSAKVVGSRFEVILENPSGKTGYAAGWRGDINWELWDENLALPGTRLSVGTRVENDLAGLEYVGNGAFPLISFEPAAVEKGDWYWLIVGNENADPVHNYMSLDFLLGDTTQCSDMQVWWRWMEKGSYAPWQLKAGWLPSPVNIYYEDGFTQGYNGYEIDSAGNVVMGQQYGFIA